MKLRTKLLPIATLGSVATVVVPLTTSCGAGWIDVTQKVDTTNWEQAAGSATMTADDKLPKTIEYLKAVKDKPEIASNDFLWSGNTYYTEIKELLDSLSEKNEEHKNTFSYQFNKFEDKLTNVKVDETSAQSNKYYLISFENGLHLDVEADIDGRFLDMFALTGHIKVKANFEATYKNMLGEINFKNELITPDTEQGLLTYVIMALIFGPGSLEDGAYFTDTTFRVNVLDTINAKTKYGIETPDYSFGYKGSLDISYVNPNDNSLNMNLHFDGNKTYTKSNIEETQWDEDLLTNAALVLTGQWYSYYMAKYTMPEEQPE